MDVYNYESEVFCWNCGFKGKEKITKGTQVNRHNCPNCNCETLKRIKKEVKKK